MKSEVTGEDMSGRSPIYPSQVYFSSEGRAPSGEWYVEFFDMYQNSLGSRHYRYKEQIYKELERIKTKKEHSWDFIEEAPGRRTKIRKLIWTDRE